MDGHKKLQMNYFTLKNYHIGLLLITSSHITLDNLDNMYCDKRSPWKGQTSKKNYDCFFLCDLKTTIATI
jgi:hypothetical protein